MAKKFVDVVGLHNVFETNESQLDISTIRDSAKDRADNYSILFITADDTDSTYGYDSGSRWIWTNGKLYDCNNSKYSIIPITYDELKQLRDTNMLAPGQQYRITDYVTTVANYNNAWSAGHPFDIIVTADSNNKLNEDARAIQREGDEYFKESKLESWELKYCLDNDSTRFDWAADEASGLVPVEKIGVVTLPVSAYWYSVAYGDGKFVAIAANSSNISAYSTDGINWTQTTLPVSAYWSSITYGDGKFVAIAANSSNISAYSTDGINWTQTTLPVSANWSSITYGNGKFVAVINDISNIAAYSTDGINWTQTTLPVSAQWLSVTYGNGKFATVVINSNIAAYSTDGINWTQTALPVSTYWQSVAYGDGKFVTVASFSNTAAYSTDGINWTQTTLPVRSDWWPITYGDGKFVAASFSNTAAYSTDGINWTQTTLPVSANWSSITYGNGKFVIIAKRSNIAAYSTDGINWTRDYTYTEYETTTIPSKGVIYYMKDEFENECSYDFKNVLYKRFKITECDKHPDWIGTYHGMLNTSYETVDENDYKWYYTFSLNDSEDTDDIRDGSLFSTTNNNIYRQNKISSFIPDDSSNQRSLNDIVYRCLSGEQDDCYGNVFDVNCHHATLGMSWSRSVRVGSNNIYFSCGNNCDNWSTGNNCYKWLIGDNCDNWSTGNNCYEWFCGGGCEDWSIGNDCNNWSVGNNCYGWSCGNNVIDWMFGDGVNNKSYCANITIDSGCKCFYLTSSNTTSASLPLTNIHVMSGVKGATSNPLLINIPDVGADYTIEINKNKKTISL